MIPALYIRTTGKPDSGPQLTEVRYRASMRGHGQLHIEAGAF